MTQIENYDKINNKEVSKSMLELVTGKELTLDDVINSSEIYDKDYKHIYKSLGFNNFYDCYLYATRDIEVVHKGGNKDLNNLNKVTRTVVRNGKEMQMTVYEDHNEDDNKKQDRKETNEPITRNAKGASIEDNGVDTKVNPKTLASTISSIKKQGAPTEHLNTNASAYKNFVDEQGNVFGITAFKETDTDIILDSYTSTPDSTGVGARSIMELLKLSILKEKNAVVYDMEIQEGIEFLKTLGFKPYKDGYIMKKKDVKEFLGEYSDFL